MANEVRTSMGITFLALETPDFVRVLLPGSDPQTEGDYLELPIVQIADLETPALDALVSQWLVHLYAQCGTPSPWGIVS